MPDFEVERRLPSLTVDKDLVARIERYFTNTLLEKSDLPSDCFEKVYTVTIDDGAGSETLRSITEHLPSQFPDTTSRVTMRFDTNHTWDKEKKLGLSVKLGFGREPFYSSLSITASGADAREQALSTFASLESLLEPHRNNNRLFWPNAGWGGMLDLVAIWSLSVGAGLLLNKQVSAGSWTTLAAIALSSYRLSGRWLRPYTMFDSRADRSREEWWRWFKYGTLSFILFGSIFALFRKTIFGF